MLIALVFTKTAIFTIFGLGLALLARGTEQGLSDFVGALVLVIGACNARFGLRAYGGVGERPSNPASDHPHGQAVDIMIENWSTVPGDHRGHHDRSMGSPHADQLGVTYIIWRGQIWSVGNSDWRPYGHPSGATDATSMHLYHVHVSVHQ